MADTSKTPAQPATQPPAHQPLSRALRTFFGVGDMAFGWLGSIENFFWNFFLTNVAMFSVQTTAAVSMLVTAVDVPLSPLWGGIVNSTKPGKFGRYRTWLVTFPWIVILTYPFMFLKIGTGFTSVAIIAAGAIISHIIYALPWTANLVLVSVAGRTPEGRAALSSTRATWSSAGAIAFSYGAPALIALIIARTGPNLGYGGIAFVTAILFALGYLVNFLVTSGYEEIEAPQAARSGSKTGASRSDMIKALFQNPHLIALLIADFPRYLFASLLSTAAIYYFNYVAHDTKLLAAYMLVSALARTAGSYMSRAAMRRMGARNCAILMYGIVGAACFAGYINYLNPWWVIIFLAVANLANGVNTATEPALFADTAIFSQWKLGADARGWIMGLSVFPIKLAFVARSGIINLVLALVGFSAAIPAAEATAELQRGISMALLLIPGGFIILGMLILIFGYRLTPALIHKYQEEINQRAG